MIHKEIADNIDWLATQYEIPERVAEHAVLMYDDVKQIAWRTYAVRHSKDGNDAQAMDMWHRHLGPQDFRDLEAISVDMATRLCGLETCRRSDHGRYKRSQPRRPRVLNTNRARVAIR
ncbi:hypothetical protein ABZ419_03155 [Streptomyces cinnamoneus]|uniref:hypothetical protein n=1 Tax=Streptomyces cinnamoneus TaxID=53446 RepID=UPI0033E55DD2